MRYSINILSLLSHSAAADDAQRDLILLIESNRFNACAARYKCFWLLSFIVSRVIALRRRDLRQSSRHLSEFQNQLYIDAGRRRTSKRIIVPGIRIGILLLLYPESTLRSRRKSIRSRPREVTVRNTLCRSPKQMVMGIVNDREFRSNF